MKKAMAQQMRKQRALEEQLDVATRELVELKTGRSQLERQVSQCLGCELVLARCSRCHGRLAGASIRQRMLCCVMTSCAWHVYCATTGDAAARPCIPDLGHMQCNCKNPVTGSTSWIRATATDHVT